MLLHLSSRRSYWFCNHCRLEMPTAAKASRNRNVDLSTSLEAAIAPVKSHQSVAIA